MAQQYAVAVVDTSGDSEQIESIASYAQEELADTTDILGRRLTEEQELVISPESVDEKIGYDTPEVGEEVTDPNVPHWSTGRVEVTEVTDKEAHEVTIPSDSLEEMFGDPKTVASENPGEPADAPVVKGRYVNQSGNLSKTEYHFPVTRFEEYGSS